MADQGVFEFKDKKVRAFFKRIDKNLKNINKGKQDFVDTIAPIAFQDVMAHFANERGPKKKWVDWSTSYARFMQKIGKGGNAILQDNGRLRNSVQIAKAAKGNDLKILFNDAKTKGGFPYAKAHDEGGPQLPQREYMWLSRGAMDKIGIATLDFMVGS